MFLLRCMILSNFNPRPPRGGRLSRRPQAVPFPSISIHALREEGDYFAALPDCITTDFNPRPPRGGRLSTRPALICMDLFQSTPSARRATHCKNRPRHLPQISIHALREEGDGELHDNRRTSQDFNPRPPRGGRPQNCSREPCRHHISIHALREEGDGAGCLIQPCEDIFQSTPSARRATAACKPKNPVWRISIHALREEGDSDALALNTVSSKFQSTPSARRATRVV